MSPYILHQTWKNKDLTPFVNYHKTFYDLKWLEIKIYDDNDIDNYIKKNFKEYYNFFKNLNHKIEKVDFFRYCVLYNEGGIYCDLDVSCINGSYLKKLLDSNKIILGVEKSLFRNLIGQAIMISPPKNKFWLNLIKFINNCYSIHRYPPYNTGPDLVSAFYKIFKNNYQDLYIDDKIYNNIFIHHCTGTWRSNVNNLYKNCLLCKNVPQYCYCYNYNYWN